MTTIVTRITGVTAKLLPLSNAELDNNFINLNNDKVEASANIITLSGTGAIRLPLGNITARPTPTDGMIRFNSETVAFEGYKAGAWSALGGEEFVAPSLGTPISGILTNCTGTASGLTAGTVTTNANLTGTVTSTGNATTIADAALSIAKTSGLQTALDGMQPLDTALTTLAAGSDFVQFTGPGTSTKVFTLPDASSTILVSGGALGTPISGILTNCTGTASGLTAGTVTNGVYTTDKDASGGVAGLTLFKLNLRNAANTITSFFTTAATVARTWTLPDKDGTVAMTSDITGTNSGTNTGDQGSIVGITGTIAQFNTAVTDANLATVTATNTFVGAQIGTVTPLTSTAATMAINLATNNNFSHTTSENTTLAAPSNPVAGQSGVITITQGATARTLSYNTFWKFAGGTVPTLTATASAVDVFAYYVVSATLATCQLIKDVK